MKTLKGGVAMKTLQLHDLVPHRGQVASYLKRLLIEEGAVAIQLPDEELLEIWDYHDIHRYVDIVEEALDEKVLYISLENLWLMAEEHRKTDPEKRPMKFYVISLLESFLASVDYECVVVYDWGGWEIILHGELTKEQAKEILMELGLK
jgi:hypothetical protein